MRKQSSSTKSRPKHKTQIRHQNPDASSSSLTLSKPNKTQPHKVIIRSNSATSLSPHHDKSNSTLSQSIYFHHHQHEHNHYVHHKNSNPVINDTIPQDVSQTSTSTFLSSPTKCCFNCEFKKCIICSLLIFVGYYILFIAISMIYKNNSNFYTNQNLLNPLEIVNTNEIEIVTENVNINHPILESISINTINTGNTIKLAQDENSVKQANRLQKVRERRRKRRRNRRRRPKIDVIWEKLPKFPQLYISDVPYYLDKNLVIIGQIHNSEEHINDILRQLESVSCLFNSTTFILFESNSDDNTLLYLQNFKSKSNTQNCEGIMFNPNQHVLYKDIDSIDKLLKIYDTDDSQEIDNIIYDYLNMNYNDINELDLYKISEFIMDNLVTINNQTNNHLNEPRLEEILYDKLIPIKYTKYQNKILDKINDTYQNVYKNILVGDDIVREELDIENQILKQLKVYGGLNELHNGYNVMKIKGYQENMDKLSELKLKYAEHRKAMLLQREQERLEGIGIENNVAVEVKNNYNVTTEKFRNNLYRIERFVIYRNMLLNQTKLFSKLLNIQYDYIMVVDMDIFSIDFKTYFNELYYTPSNIHGLCIDGIDWMGWTRDTFATVKANGGWLHYGEDRLGAINNNTRYIYNNRHTLEMRQKFPLESQRYEIAKSCFGGVMVYKNFNDSLLKSKCKYTLTRDIWYTLYENSDVNISPKKDKVKYLFNYTYDYWLNNRHHNDYSNQSKMEIKSFLNEYIEILQERDANLKNRKLFPKDGDICEHIPFNYCLADENEWKFAISTRSKLYYQEEYPTNRPGNDTNWNYYLSNRLKFTL